jgi:hypothetical protein
MKKMKGKEQKDKNLFMQNTKPHVSHNGYKTIPNNLVRSNTLPNMGAIKKVGPY